MGIDGIKNLDDDDEVDVVGWIKQQMQEMLDEEVERGNVFLRQSGIDPNDIGQIVSERDRRGRRV